MKAYPGWPTIIKAFPNLVVRAYVAYNTFRDIEKGIAAQKAFFDACQEENLYGNRKGIVQDRKAVADYLKEWEIIVNPLDRF